MQRLPSGPVRTGSARIHDVPCVLCGRTETAKYQGQALLDDAEVDEEQICIACINDGAAHDRLGATFTQNFSDEDGWAEMASGIVERIRERTPAVFTWQAPRWLACCGDAAIYLGVLDQAGEHEVRTAPPPEPVAHLVRPAGDAAPSWYLFPCSHRGDYSTFRDEP